MSTFKKQNIFQKNAKNGIFKNRHIPIYVTLYNLDTKEKLEVILSQREAMLTNENIVEYNEELHSEKIDKKKSKKSKDE